MKQFKNDFQERTLIESQKSKKDVTVILVGGVRMVGTVFSFDDFTIMLNVKGQKQLIFKHAVSTIVPKGVGK